MQDRSWEIRTDHQHKTQEKAAEEQRKDVETIIREMRQREIQSRMFARIGNTLKSINYAQITRLGLPKHIRSESTEQIWNYIQSASDEKLKRIEWEYTEDRDEIERRLLEWNILHFNQAYASPLATKYW